jgi:hypothetical protein
MTTTPSTAKKRFLLLHVGFTPPTPEIMKAWGAWMASLQGIQVDVGGFMGGTEITHTGERALPWDATSETGYNIIEVENKEAALDVARRAPSITAIRVYELRSH